MRFLLQVLIVEFLNIAEGKAALEKFMVNQGYEIFPSTAAERAKGKWAEDDHIFVKKGVGLNEYILIVSSLVQQGMRFEDPKCCKYFLLCAQLLCVHLNEDCNLTFK
jgi:hypothetical protein